MSGLWIIKEKRCASLRDKQSIQNVWVVRAEEGWIGEKETQGGVKMRERGDGDEWDDRVR